MTVDRPLHRTIRRGLMLSVAVSLFGLVWLNARTVRPATLQLLQRADPLYLALAAAAMVLAWATETWRMQVLLRLSGERVPFRRLWRVVLATFFAASVTPFASGQGPVQVYLLHREGPSVGSATAILSLRVFLTILVFAAGVPLLLLFFRLGITERVHTLVNWAVAASFVLAGAFFAFLRHPHQAARALHAVLARALSRFLSREAFDRALDRLVAEADEFTSTVGRLGPRRLTLLVAAGLLTVLYWLCYFSVAPFLLVAFHRSFSPVKVVALQTVFFFLLSAVPIPGGSGLAELGFAQLFAHLLPAALVGVFVSLWRLVTYHLSVVVGALVFLDILRRPHTVPDSGGSSSV